MTVIDNIFDPEPVLEQVPILDCRRTLDSRDRAVIRNIEGMEKVGVKRPPPKKCCRGEDEECG